VYPGLHLVNVIIVTNASIARNFVDVKIMSRHSNWPLTVAHCLLIVGMLLLAGVFAALVEIAKPLSTSVAMTMRGIAWFVTGFGPAISYGWLLAKDADRQTITLTWPQTFVRYFCGAVLFGVSYALAALAFPGPWLSDD
jgi:hypothetical protein